MNEYTLAAASASETIPDESAEPQASAHQHQTRGPQGVSREEQDKADYELLMANLSCPKSGQDLGFFNPRAPRIELKHENARQRNIVYLKAAGRSNKEIAEMLGISPVTVSYVINQPWAQERIVELIHENGLEPIQTLLRGAAADSVMRLISEKDNMDAAPRDRIVAADKILDRVFGKPNQPMTHYNAKDLESMTDEQLINLGSHR